LRIFFLGKRHYTNKDAFSEPFGRIAQLPLAWQRAGHTVEHFLLDYYGFGAETSRREGLPVHSVPAASLGTPGRLKAAVQALRPDFVMASGDCFIGLIAYWLSRRARSGFVFDVYDDYRTFAGYRVFMGWDALGFLCGRANAVTYASRVMAAAHVFGSEAHVVPNGVDDTVFVPMPRDEARMQLGLPTKGRMVGYFGSMTPEHGVGVLKDAVAKLRTILPDLQLLLCGRRHPSTTAAGEGVLYRGEVAHELMPAYLNACDVLALPYLRGRFLDQASSCKIAEYLFCRKPIVATRTPNFVENFPDAAKALDARLVLPGDVDALAHAIVQQLDQPVVPDPPANMTWNWIAESLTARLQNISGG
jgi:glycosyltransferase involved in cell wall biosynthesis